MTFVSAVKDPAARTLTFIAEFDAPIERVWRVWSDRRTLERWWGPPEYPATISAFEFAPGGRMHYRLAGDVEGDALEGQLAFVSIDEPREIVYEELFVAEDEGVEETPVNRSVVTFDAADGITRMTIITTFPSDEGFEQALEFGALEGFEAGVSQVDALLAEMAASV